MKHITQTLTETVHCIKYSVVLSCRVVLESNTPRIKQQKKKHSVNAKKNELNSHINPQQKAYKYNRCL